MEKFSSTTDEITCNDFHTWGCPVFVLDEANQSGLTGSPKWDPRARADVYLGHSHSHAGNVSIILNLKTGHVSPQYYIVFDDEFSTVAYIPSDEESPIGVNVGKTTRNLSQMKNMILLKLGIQMKPPLKHMKFITTVQMITMAFIFNHQKI